MLLENLNTEILKKYQKNKNLFYDYKLANKATSDYNYFSFPDFPSFITKTTHLEVLEACSHVQKALSYAIALLMQSRLKLDDVDLKEYMDIPDYIFDWIRKEDSTRMTSVFWGRPDFVIGHDGPRYIEANLASAAGYQMQVSGLLDYYIDHPIYGGDLKKENIQYEDPLLCFSQSLSRNSKPGELILFTDIFEENRHKTREIRPYSGMIKLINDVTGLKIKSAFVDELKMNEKSLFYQDELIKCVFLSYYNPHVFSFDDVYKKVWDFKEKKQFQCIDSMYEILYSNKILFAFLSEFIHQLPFQNSIKSGFEKFVPWTRIVRDCKTEYKNEKTSMDKLLIKFQQNFVLKKAQSAESKDVYIGSQTDEKAWKQLIATAFTSKNWVVQEMVESKAESFLEIKDNELVQSNCDYVLSPYLSEGQFSGYLKRYIRKNDEAKKNTAVYENLRSELATSFIIS